MNSPHHIFFVTLGLLVEMVFCFSEGHSGRYHDNDSLHGVDFSISLNKGPLCRAKGADSMSQKFHNFTDVT